jgi:hypothetical protein
MQSRIDTQKKTSLILYEFAIHCVRTSYGKLFNVMQAVENDMETILSKVVKVGIPKRLNQAAMTWKDALPSLTEETIDFIKNWYNTVYLKLTVINL